MAISNTGFISTVNQVADKLDVIQSAVDDFDQATIDALNSIDTDTVNEVTDDLTLELQRSHTLKTRINANQLR